MDKWLIEGFPTNANTLNSTIRDFTFKGMNNARDLGDPKLSNEEMELEVRRILRICVNPLRDFLKSITWRRIQTQVEMTQQLGNVEAYAILDTLVTLPDGRELIIEGKSTRKPSKTTEDQIRWQIDTLSNPADTHYYFFYQTGQLWPVHLDETHNKLWVPFKEERLSQLVQGENDPHPSSYACSICPFTQMCDSVHKVTRREPLIKAGLPGKTKVAML